MTLSANASWRNRRGQWSYVDYEDGMPLYTYVTAYKGSVHVAQGRHGNFKGFPTWFANLPANALPELTPTLRKNINPYRGDFEPIQNQERVWRESLMIGDSELTVVAIETKG